MYKLSIRQKKKSTKIYKQADLPVVSPKVVFSAKVTVMLAVFSDCTFTALSAQLHFLKYSEPSV